MIAKIIFIILSFFGVEVKGQQYYFEERPSAPGDTFVLNFTDGFVSELPIRFYRDDSVKIQAPNLRLGTFLVTSTILSDWNSKIPTVFGWGNHASAGYSTASNSQTFTNKGGNISQWTNNSGYITGITSGNVTTALGYTPYNATNPSGYVSDLSSFTTSNLSEGSNQYWTNSRFDTRLGTKSTSDLSEGSNLYYTAARFNTAFSGKSTTDLSEGSNLYFTNARARSTLSAGAGISYNSSTGEITNTSIIPVGVIYIYPADSPPTGYLICDGSAVSRSTYSALFEIIGTLYGAGDGSTTFNLPDFRQRFPLGQSASGTGSILAGMGGQIDMVYSINPPSTSSSSDGSHSHTGTTSAPSATVAATILAGGAASTTHTHTFTTSSDGAHTHTTDIGAFNTAANNPSFITINYIIKH